ncbi:tumor necrosis factor receptor superfamily member 22 isoform X1 [Equus caballus]|uniref:TNFR-Cys domain-containing protein n=1 Tax=Equus caballus TaxID=9796 RepID=A0A9L0RV25_HORSE|nr:tumor necrosis factor receptor superfamily member 22-like isoform X1 [Equus caballus]
MARRAALALLLLRVQVKVTTETNLVSKQSQVPPGPESCGPDEYWSAGHCCKLCPAGSFVEEHCRSHHTRGKCTPCDRGTFTAHANGLDSCNVCATCSENEQMVAECTSTRDRTCQCQTGRFYRPPGGLEFCSRCSKCPRGSVVLKKCNATADTVCGLAGPGGRHRWCVIGSFLTFLVIMIVTYIYARKREEKGCWGACHRLAVGDSDGGESMLPENSVPGTPLNGNPDAESPFPTMADHSLCNDSLDIVSEASTPTRTPENPVDVCGPQLVAGERSRAPEQSPQAGPSVSPWGRGSR